MLVNPMTFKHESGGGGESPVIETGLQIRKRNYAPLAPESYNFQSDYRAASSDANTLEIHFTTSGIPSGQTWGYFYQLPHTSTSSSFVLSISTASGDIPTGGDFGLLVTIGGTDFRVQSVLLFNTPYTITAKIENGETRIYVNGVYSDIVTKTFTFSGNHLGIFRRSDAGTNSDRTINGMWYEFRWYNRILTDSEIVQNYNADVANYDT